VNLTDVDKPQDVYSGIAELVAAKVAEDASNGLLPAKLLVDNVDRKLVKQTVMTSVYGVTFVGAREQIASRLRDRGWENDRMIYQASKYGAKVTMDKLHEMFQSAKYIMNWLADCARAVAADDKPMAWTTPMGLPVVQPYRRNGTRVVTTVLQRMVLKDHSSEAPIMKQRQRSAFPPNYIHSIDSTHMMMTAIACRERGLSFAGVHDSFWTHAGTIDTMNSILREKFLELHSRPLLEELLDQLQVCYMPLHDPSPGLPQL
jgi:DNA-directed RNA polymerase